MNHKNVRIGVIGCGYWGPKLIRNLQEVERAKIVGAADLKPARLEYVKKLYPTINTTKDDQELIHDPSIDAIVIATAVSTHYRLAKEAIMAGKHVLVEKPMTSNSEEARSLIKLAKNNGRVLMVDHTFLYTGAVRKIKEIIESGELGEIYYFDSMRISLGLFQHDVNVLWDLAPHDISIMDYLVNHKAIELSAIGRSHFANGVENIAYITIIYENTLIAHINVNWLSPVKIRRVLIGGSKKMLLYDDNESNEKVKVYDAGVEIMNNNKNIYEVLFQYRTGDMYSPKVNLGEALKLECEHFIDCITNDKKPLTDGEAGLRAVNFLEAAEHSIKNKGKTVKL